MGETIMNFGAMSFWLFIAIVAVAGIWDGVKKREAHHETLRRIIDSGKDIDDAAIDRILKKADGTSENLARDLNVSGIIMLFIAPGLAILGYFIGLKHEAAFMPLVGVALLVLCIAFGLMVAAKAVNKYNNK